MSSARRSDPHNPRRARLAVEVEGASPLASVAVGVDLRRPGPHIRRRPSKEASRMLKDGIPGWVDREGRLWLDTGAVKHGQPVIELINGEARAVFSWVDAKFGPLKRPDEL